jgi:hypothetical protein
MGLIACGGGAVAWHAAFGGLAIAHDFAVGGLAIANHANDETTRTFFQTHPFFALSGFVLKQSRWFLLLVPVPIILLLARRRKGGRTKNGFTRMRVLALLACLACRASALEADYVVADAVGKNDPFYKAVERLAAHRHGQIVPLELDDLTGFRDALRGIQPSYVAVVLRPERLDYELARRFLEMATQVDDDPFVDFSYGFITGATAEETMAFVERSVQAEQTKREPELGSIGVWEIGQSQTVRGRFALRGRSIPIWRGASRVLSS